jgi:hypothetical protein
MIAPAPEQKYWTATTPDGELTIGADAVSIECGALVFRREGKVWIALAPGNWTAVSVSDPPGKEGDTVL